MRTTLTLDDAVAAMLKRLAHTRQTSFRETVKEALELGLREMAAPAKPNPYRTVARRLGASSGVDPTKLGQTDDDAGDLHRMGMDDPR